mmetsp:Transcript_52042/g.123917  ORF Transcript_52042/g.123917 Transcript_52042/m.123917 type:complete len:424 (+) Transcript_52042:108-1379(+)
MWSPGHSPPNSPMAVARQVSSPVLHHRRELRDTMKANHLIAPELAEQQRRLHELEARLKSLRHDDGGKASLNSSGRMDDDLEARLREATAKIDALDMDLQKMEDTKKPPPRAARKSDVVGGSYSKLVATGACSPRVAPPPLYASPVQAFRGINAGPCVVAPLPAMQVTPLPPPAANVQQEVAQGGLLTPSVTSFVSQPPAASSSLPAAQAMSPQSGHRHIVTRQVSAATVNWSSASAGCSSPPMPANPLAATPLVASARPPPRSMSDRQGHGLVGSPRSPVPVSSSFGYGLPPPQSQAPQLAVAAKGAYPGITVQPVISLMSAPPPPVMYTHAGPCQVQQQQSSRGKLGIETPTRGGSEKGSAFPRKETSPRRRISWNPSSGIKSPNRHVPVPEENDHELSSHAVDLQQKLNAISDGRGKLSL